MVQIKQGACVDKKVQMRWMCTEGAGLSMLGAVLLQNRCGATAVNALPH